LGKGAGGRRAALWTAGAVAQARPGRLAGIVTGVSAPPLPAMTEVEENRADLWATGVSPDSHPVQFLRKMLTGCGVVAAEALAGIADRQRVRVAGLVTHRQRPATAGGTLFLNLEDETGLVNVICPEGVWARYRRVARAAPALVVTGQLEKVEGVINLVATRMERLDLSTPLRSRDFR
jgi:error-prone DNA polymerase